MLKDQPNLGFHGRDIFCELAVLLFREKCTSVKFHEVCDFFCQLCCIC